MQSLLEANQLDAHHIEWSFPSRLHSKFVPCFRSFNPTAGRLISRTFPSHGQKTMKQSNPSLLWPAPKRGGARALTKRPAIKSMKLLKAP